MQTASLSPARLPHLARALPVDFEQDVGAGFHFLFDHQARGAIVITMDFGPFQKFAAGGAGVRPVLQATQAAVA